MKATLAAVPVIGACSLVANIPKAEAGPVTYFACVVACESTAVAAACGDWRRFDSYRGGSSCGVC